ncbi:MAG: hypothetical protein KGL39_15290 [Patescibacteria group bacterium]|nr:hypothetical protein [Patescibacteria group bacterium]
MAATTRASATKPTLAKLTEKFPVETYRKNPKGFHYIPIEQHIARWQEVCGAGWDIHVVQSEYGLTPGVTFGNRNPKPGAYAVVGVEITAELDGRTVTRGGVGGDFGAADDVDKLVKTALAEAIKKAGNEFGIGLELWDEEERALIDAAQAQGMTGQVVAAGTAPPLTVVQDDELTVLKNRVADIAVAAGVERTGPSIAAHFGIPVEQLQDRTVLERLISQSAVVAI